MGNSREPAADETQEVVASARGGEALPTRRMASLTWHHTPDGVRTLQRAIGNASTVRVLARDDYVPTISPRMETVAERELDPYTRPPSQRMLKAYAPVSYDVWKADDASPDYWKQRNQPWEFFGGSIGKGFGAKDPSNPKPGEPQHTCAARLSWALNHLGGADITSGATFPNDPSVTYAGKKGDGKKYIVGAPGMTDYLKKHWGPPDKTIAKNQDAVDLKSGLAADQVAVFSGNHHCGLLSNSLRVQDYVEYDPEVVPAYAWILDPWR